MYRCSKRNGCDAGGRYLMQNLIIGYTQKYKDEEKGATQQREKS